MNLKLQQDTIKQEIPEKFMPYSLKYVDLLVIRHKDSNSNLPQFRQQNLLIQELMLSKLVIN